MVEVVVVVVGEEVGIEGERGYEADIGIVG